MSTNNMRYQNNKRPKTDALLILTALNPGPEGDPLARISPISDLPSPISHTKDQYVPSKSNLRNLRHTISYKCHLYSIPGIKLRQTIHVSINILDGTISNSGKDIT